MPTTLKQIWVYICLFWMVLIFSCTKDASSDGPIDPPSSSKLSYGDSVFYINKADYIISPNISQSGTYTAFPDNLQIDQSTGKIMISVEGKDGKATQTGLRYRIIFKPSAGDPDTTHIILAGINFQDRIYDLTKNQAFANPIYNATPSLSIPAGNYSASDKVSINSATGQIDLKKTLENGLFNATPENNDWRLVTIEYETNNGSNIIKNDLDVVMYYYTAIDKIPSNVSATMKAHQNLLLGVPSIDIPVTSGAIDESVKSIVSVSKPRPPCIIIIGR